MTFTPGKRATPATFGDEIVSVDPQPIVLLDITTGTSPANIRITTNESDMEWPTGSGNTFSSRPFTISEHRIDPEEFPSVTVELGDVDDSFDTWLNTTTFRNQSITRYILDRDQLTQTTFAITDKWRISHRIQTPEKFSFVAEPLQAILARVTLPQRTLTREDFPGIRPDGTVS